MEENKPKQSPAYGIAMVIFFIIFLLIYTNLPFPEDYSFGNILGIGAGACIVGGVIYALAVGITESIYKILVEVFAVFILFINVTVTAICWVSFSAIRTSFELDMGIAHENSGIVAVLSLAFLMLLFNLFVVFMLYPLAQIAGTRIDPE